MMLGAFYGVLSGAPVRHDSGSGAGAALEHRPLISSQRRLGEGFNILPLCQNSNHQGSLVGLGALLLSHRFSPS